MRSKFVSRNHCFFLKILVEEIKYVKLKEKEKGGWKEEDKENTRKVRSNESKETKRN